MDAHVIRAELGLDIPADASETDLEALKFELAEQLGISPACIHDLRNQPDTGDGGGGGGGVTLTIIEPTGDDLVNTTDNRTEISLVGLPGRGGGSVLDGRDLVAVTLFQPEPPVCDELRSNLSALHVTIEPSTGFYVLGYQLTLRGPLTTDDGGFDPLARDDFVLWDIEVGRAPGDREIVVPFLMPDTPYRAVSRVKTTLGWSEWSDEAVPCVTPPRESSPFDWLLVFIILLLLCCCFLCFLFFCWRRFKDNVIAPRLKKKTSPAQDEERQQRHSFMEEYMSSDHDPMGDDDPEIVVNPVQQHKMDVARALEEERRKAKFARQGKGPTGGLKRLGFGKETTSTEDLVPEMSKPMKAMDNFLAQQGVASGNKPPSKTARGSEEGARVGERSSSARKTARGSADERSSGKWLSPMGTAGLGEMSENSGKRLMSPTSPMTPRDGASPVMGHHSTAL